MEGDVIVVAPFNNKEAWEKADFICDGIADNVEIQAAIETASSQKRKLRLEPGTYNTADVIFDPMGVIQ